MRALLRTSKLVAMLKARRPAGPAPGQLHLFGGAHGLVPKQVTVPAHTRADGTHVQQHTTTVYVRPDEPAPVAPREPTLLERAQQTLAALAATGANVQMRPTQPDAISQHRLNPEADEQLDHYWATLAAKADAPTTSPPHVRSMFREIVHAMFERETARVGIDRTRSEWRLTHGHNHVNHLLDQLARIVRPHRVDNDHWWTESSDVEGLYGIIMAAGDWEDAERTMRLAYPQHERSFRVVFSYMRAAIRSDVVARYSPHFNDSEIDSVTRSHISGSFRYGMAVSEFHQLHLRADDRMRRLAGDAADPATTAMWSRAREREDAPPKDQRRLTALWFYELADGLRFTQGLAAVANLERVQAHNEAAAAVQTVIDSGDRGLALHHWGSANSHNPTARAAAVYGDHGRFRPLDRWDDGDKVVPTSPTDEPGHAPLTTAEQAEGAARYVRAQRMMTAVGRGDHPTVWRGMMVAADAVDAIQAALKAPNGSFDLPLTGCTAFSFIKSVAENYAQSAWTQNIAESQHGAERRSVVMHLTRTDGFDASVAGWHPKNRVKDTPAENTEPAFEIVSAAKAFRVTRAVLDEEDNVWHVYGEAVT